jgi:cold shock CspA family protein
MQVVDIRCSPGYPAHVPENRTPWNVVPEHSTVDVSEEAKVKKRKCEEHGAEGVCAWYDTNKGFGFVVPKGSDWTEERNRTKDIFVHQSVINCDGFRRLNRGQLVRYQAGHDDKAIWAAPVQAVDNEKKRRTPILTPASHETE